MRSKPLPSGSIKSRTTRSACGASRSAAASVGATVTVKPSRRREVRDRLRDRRLVLDDQNLRHGRSLARTAPDARSAPAHRACVAPRAGIAQGQSHRSRESTHRLAHDLPRDPEQAIVPFRDQLEPCVINHEPPGPELEVALEPQPTRSLRTLRWNAAPAPRSIAANVIAFASQIGSPIFTSGGGGALSMYAARVTK